MYMRALADSPGARYALGSLFSWLPYGGICLLFSDVTLVAGFAWVVSYLFVYVAQRYDTLIMLEWTTLSREVGLYGSLVAIPSGGINFGLIELLSRYSFDRWAVLSCAAIVAGSFGYLISRAVLRD